MNSCGHNRIRFALHTLLTCVLPFAFSACGGEKPTREQAIERYSQELRQPVSTLILLATWWLLFGGGAVSALVVAGKRPALHRRPAGQEDRSFRGNRKWPRWPAADLRS
jgi:hypothetical protein